MYYGFPDLKAAASNCSRQHGPIVDPDTQDRAPALTGCQDHCLPRPPLPLLRGAPLTETRVCQYENSSNGDFLIDFHPGHDNVLLVGGGSGHGFKHGPEVGRYAAARLLGADQAEPRFSLATKAETHKREVH